MLLKSGDEMPHFRATTVEGRPFRYDEIWQRKNLVLIVLPAERPESATRVSVARLTDWSITAVRTAGDDTEWVITRDEIEGVGTPGVVVADKWGEIQFAQSARSLTDLPNGDELAEWLDYVRYQCPECQGEAK